MTENKIGFGVLGPLQMSVDGTPVPLGAPKQRAVLAMLVINRNRPVGIDSLINAVWERVARRRGAGQPALLYLQPAPAARRRRNRHAKSVLVNAPPGYRLNVADADCDLGRFIVEKTAGVHAAAAGRFEQASQPPVRRTGRMARTGP